MSPPPIFLVLPPQCVVKSTASRAGLSGFTPGSAILQSCDLRQVPQPWVMKCQCLAFTKCSQKVSLYYLTAKQLGETALRTSVCGQCHLLAGSGSPFPGLEAGCLSPPSGTAGNTDSCPASRSLCGGHFFRFPFPLWRDRLLCERNARTHVCDPS